MMDRLFDAARRGNVEELRIFLREDPLILHYVAVESCENPLDSACLCGHLDFAREILILKPEFAKKLNPKGYSPLHLAAANGHVEIVQELARFDPGLCRLKGKDMRTALHCAALRGEIRVINEILSVCPECVEDVTIQGETALHLAVKSSQYESLRVLLDWVSKMGKTDIIHIKDQQNNTALNLAIQMQERWALQLLSNENESGTWEMAFPTNVGTESSVSSSSEYFKFRRGRDSPSDARNVLLVIAVLVATASFQVGLSPPGGTWQDNSVAVGSNNSDSYQRPIAGTSIMGTYYPDSFAVMIGLNSFAFMVSLSMIAMLTSRFPFRVELLICISSLYFTYCKAVNHITPTKVHTYTFVFTSVVPTSIPFAIYLSRKYVGPMLAPFGCSLIKYKLFRFLTEFYG